MYVTCDQWDQGHEAALAEQAQPSPVNAILHDTPNDQVQKILR